MESFALTFLVVFLSTALGIAALAFGWWFAGVVGKKK
jgi:hypothetical protein